jgi:hypothetical protein
VSSVVLNLFFPAIRVHSCQFVVERNQLDAELRRTDKGAVGKRKIMRIYLIGMLCGVLLATAFTYMFAVPANSDYWRMEIYKRGGGAFTMDMKTGRTGWKWMVDPIPDSPPQKPVALPASQTKSRTEKL